jgi:hypothetical protein
MQSSTSVIQAEEAGAAYSESSSDSHESESRSLGCTETAEACATGAAEACAARTAEPNRKGSKENIIMDKMMAEIKVPRIMI